MPRLGFSYRFVADDRKFEQVAFIYHLALVATMFCLLRFVFRCDEYDIFAFNLSSVEISKVTFRWTMGLLASMMVSPYLMSLFIRCYYKAIGYASTQRAYEELAMIIGFFSLIFFSVNLFGFWGIILLPVSPPFLVLALQVAVIRFSRANIKTD